MQTSGWKKNAIAAIEARLGKALDCEARRLGIAGADSAAPAALGGDEADEEDESPFPWPAAEPLPEQPAVRWWRMAASCYAARVLWWRAPPWHQGCAKNVDATALIIVSVNLFGIASGFAPRDEGALAEGANAEAAAETAAIYEKRKAVVDEAAREAGAAAVPLWPAERSLEDDLRGSAQAYLAARKARSNASNAGSAAAAKALAGSVRDVVAWRCVRLSGAHSEEDYLSTLDAAFDGRLSGDKDLKSQLLNSFHHVIGPDPNAFKSRPSQRRQRLPRKSRSAPRGSSPGPAPPQDFAFHLPSEGDHQWMQQGMHFARTAAEKMPRTHQETAQLMELMWAPSLQMGAPDNLGSGALLGGAEDPAQAFSTVIDGGLQPDASGFQMGLDLDVASLAPGLWEDNEQLRNAYARVLEAELRRLSQDNQTLQATVADLRRRVSSLQWENSRLLAPQAQVALGPTEDPEADGGAERIHLLEFSRHPQEFRQALNQGWPLDECRQALQKAERVWEQPGGAKVFVHPHQFEETMDLIKKLGLLKQHVVAAESLVSKVMLSVETLCSELEVRVMRCCELGVVGTSAASSSEAAREDERQRRENKRREGVAAVKRTQPYFIATQLAAGGGGNPGGSRPPTPDPTDPTLSKREWEKGVQKWRRELSRKASQQRPEQRANDMPEGVAALKRTELSSSAVVLSDGDATDSSVSKWQ